MIDRYSIMIKIKIKSKNTIVSVTSGLQSLIPDLDFSTAAR